MIINIYTTPNCAYCVKAKNFFRKHNLNFLEIDVTTDVKSRDAMVKKTGQYGVPVIIVDDRMVIGFNEAKLRELCQITTN